ncbi:MAG TPA: helix-turn-helix domain-containing protein [Cyclobacteriaceae bacterium]|nr:helix-turn-helix domain-containing protein [Cyclobacteriaceae bacterium]
MDPEKEPTMDDRFLGQVEKVIEQNLANETFSVEDLSAEVGLSRSMLHRRLKKLTGKSASDLISETRLKRARRFLENNVATVSEIAYRVGFNSPSYFNKVFQKHYGISPGEVRKGASIAEGVPTLIPENRMIKRKNLWLAILTFAVVMIMIIGLVYFRSPTKSEFSVAVLPLDDLTGEPDNAYFVDGLHDALIGQLGQISSLRVISRTSTLRYRDSGMLLRDIAKDLGVDHIVEGSVFTAGDSLRMIIQLIKVFPVERHLWAHEYHNRMDKVLTIQASAVKDIAQNIRINITPHITARLSASREVNPETYKSYLRGMYYLNKGTAESFESGIKYLHDAIDNDPGDPLAYAGLALGYALVGHGPLSEEEAFLRATAAASKAIRLDSTIDEAHTALALLNLYKSWDWTSARDAFEHALLVNPSNEIAHAHYAWYHVLFGTRDQAIYHARKAIEIEPFSGAYHSWLAWIYYYYGEFELAEKYARKSLALQENLPYGLLVLNWTYLRKGMLEEALALSEKFPSNGDIWYTMKGYSYFKAGMNDKAMALWEDFNAQSSVRNVNSCYLGLMAGYLGFADRSFTLLNEAVEHKTYPISYIDVFPGSDYIREDSRYATLMKKMNLPYQEKNLAANQ